jgi:hypothetical protein
MATEKQIAANRHNAAKSTGPRTTVGKAASSRNALKHGVLSKRALSEHEDTQAFVTLLGKLVEELEPISVIECTLVERIAILLWREKRLAETEAREIDRIVDSSMFTTRNTNVAPGLKNQVLVGRYQTMLSRQMREAFRDLRLEQERRIAQIEVVNSSGI